MSKAKEQREPYEPTSDLGKMLLAVVQYLGALEPQAFRTIHARTR